MREMTFTEPTPLRRPPSAGPWGLRALREIRQDALGFFVNTAQECGDAVRFDLAGTAVFQFTHPDHNYEILVEKQRAFRKSRRVKQVLGQWSGDGLALIDGEPWARQRRLVNPSFRAESMGGHLAVVLRHSRALLASWRGRHEVNVSRDIGQLTLRVVAESLFGANVEPYIDGFGEQIALLNACAMRELGSLVLMPSWAPTPHKRRLRAAVRYLDQVVYEMIRRARSEARDDQNLLASLVRTVDDNGGSLNDREAHDAIVNLLLGGNETTATALVWTLHCLSLHPELQVDLRAELERVLAGGEPTIGTLHQLHLLERAVEETLRLYPPAYLLPREAAEDVTVGDIFVPAGSLVHLVPYITQRDARWFDQPAEFIPQRFEHKATFRRGAYLPFGLGRRLCVGRTFAQLEMMAALALILRRFELHPARSQPNFELEAQISLHPKGGLRLELQEI